MASDQRVTVKAITQKLINKARKDKDIKRVAILTTSRDALTAAAKLAPKEQPLQKLLFTPAQVQQFRWRMEMEKIGKSWLIIEDAYVQELQKLLDFSKFDADKSRYMKYKLEINRARRNTGIHSIRAFEKWKVSVGADNKA